MVTSLSSRDYALEATIQGEPCGATGELVLREKGLPPGLELSPYSERITSPEKTHHKQTRERFLFSHSCPSGISRVLRSKASSKAYAYAHPSSSVRESFQLAVHEPLLIPPYQVDLVFHPLPQPFGACDELLSIDIPV